MRGLRLSGRSCQHLKEVFLVSRDRYAVVSDRCEDCGKNVEDHSGGCLNQPLEDLREYQNEMIRDLEIVVAMIELDEGIT